MKECTWNHNHKLRAKMFIKDTCVVSWKRSYGLTKLIRRKLKYSTNLFLNVLHVIPVGIPATFWFIEGQFIYSVMKTKRALFFLVC